MHVSYSRDISALIVIAEKNAIDSDQSESLVANYLRPTFWHPQPPWGYPALQSNYPYFGWLCNYACNYIRDQSSIQLEFDMSALPSEKRYFLLQKSSMKLYGINSSK